MVGARAVGDTGYLYRDGGDGDDEVGFGKTNDLAGQGGSRPGFCATGGPSPLW